MIIRSSSSHNNLSFITKASASLSIKILAVLTTRFNYHRSSLFGSIRKSFGLAQLFVWHHLCSLHNHQPFFLIQKVTKDIAKMQINGVWLKKWSETDPQTCFCCSGCGVQLERKFFTHDDLPVCEDCYKVSADKSRCCQMPPWEPEYRIKGGGILTHCLVAF